MVSFAHQRVVVSISLLFLFPMQEAPLPQPQGEADRCRQHPTKHHTSYYPKCSRLYGSALQLLELLFAATHLGLSFWHVVAIFRVKIPRLGDLVCFHFCLQGLRLVCGQFCSSTSCSLHKFLVFIPYVGSPSSSTSRRGRQMSSTSN